MKEIDTERILEKVFGKPEMCGKNTPTADVEHITDKDLRPAHFYEYLNAIKYMIEARELLERADSCVLLNCTEKDCDIQHALRVCDFQLIRLVTAFVKNDFPDCIKE